MTRLSWCLSLSVLALGVACGGESREQPASDKVAVQFSREGKEVTEQQEGDVKITSTDGTLILAVIADSVVIQLSDSLRQSVADSVSAGTKNAGGMGAIIGNAVSAAVSTAMGFKVHVPAKNVENLRYENGELHFDVKGGTVNMNSGSAKKGSKSNGGRFAEEDARRFIDAVKAAQGRQPEM
jgi:hypothetical protein